MLFVSLALDSYPAGVFYQTKVVSLNANVIQCQPEWTVVWLVFCISLNIRVTKSRSLFELPSPLSAPSHRPNLSVPCRQRASRKTGMSHTAASVLHTNTTHSDLNRRRNRDFQCISELAKVKIQRLMLKEGSEALQSLQTFSTPCGIKSTVSPAACSEYSPLKKEKKAPGTLLWYESFPRPTSDMIEVPPSKFTARSLGCRLQPWLSWKNPPWSVLIEIVPQKRQQSFKHIQNKIFDSMLQTVKAIQGMWGFLWKTPYCH